MVHVTLDFKMPANDNVSANSLSLISVESVLNSHQSIIHGHTTSGNQRLGFRDPTSLCLSEKTLIRNMIQENKFRANINKKIVVLNGRNTYEGKIVLEPRVNDAIGELGRRLGT